MVLQFIGRKGAYALGQSLKVIGCVGELLEEREEGRTFDVVFAQLQALAGVFPAMYSLCGNSIIASVASSMTTLQLELAVHCQITSASAACTNVRLNHNL